MVYIFLAEGFEEIEAITPIDLLRRADVEVTSVGVTGKEVTGSHGITVIADITEDDLNTSDAEMIVLPGGNPGYINLEKSEIVTNAIKKAYDSGKYVAAICAAPSILGGLGLLEGKEATVYPGMENTLTGAKVRTDKEVVVDGNIITSRGAGTAIAFSGELISLLKGQKEAKKVLDAIVYRQ